MPSALKTAEEFGDDLTVLFVEVQGTSHEDVQRFAWDRKWMGTPAMWTSERPFETGIRTMPSFALVSSTGDVLLTGHPGQMHSKIEEMLAQEMDRRDKGPDDAPKAVKKAYKTLAKDKFADALAEAREVAAAGGADGEFATALVAEIESRIDGKFDRVDWMLENGYPLRAEELAETLGKGLKGSDDYAERLAEIESALDAVDMKAAKALDKIVTMLEDGGPDEGTLKKLDKFIDKADAGPLRTRAEALRAVFP